MSTFEDTVIDPTCDVRPKVAVDPILHENQVHHLPSIKTIPEHVSSTGGHRIGKSNAVQFNENQSPEMVRRQY